MPPNAPFTGREQSTMELTLAEIKLLLECLTYSVQRVSEAQGTPPAVREENLQRLRAVQEKLRQMGSDHPH